MVRRGVVQRGCGAEGVWCGGGVVRRSVGCGAEGARCGGGEEEEWRGCGVEGCGVEGCGIEGCGIEGCGIEGCSMEGCGAEGVGLQLWCSLTFPPAGSPCGVAGTEEVNLVESSPSGLR